MKTIISVLAALALPLHGAGKAAENEQKKEVIVNVGGQVRRPGPVHYRLNSTVLEMIFAAGGATEFGSMRRVKVYRDGKTLEFDLTKEKVKLETLCMPDDTIEVPAKNIFGR